MGLEKERFDNMKHHIWYHFYLDSDRYLLYIFVVLAPQRPDNLVFGCWLCKCNIRNIAAPCEVLVKAAVSLDGDVKKDFINLKGNDIQLLEIFSKISYDNVVFKAGYDYVYKYDEYFIVMNNYLSITIKDIRQNRRNILQYINSLPKSSRVNLTHSVYQDEFLIFKESVRIDSEDVFSCYYPLVFAKLKIVKHVHVE
jgi:hypothetical protein